MRFDSIEFDKESSDYVKGDIFLMVKDKTLLRYNIANADNRFKVYDYDSLPVSLKNGIRKREDIYIEFAFEEWLKSRSIPLSRENAKWLLNILSLPQNSSNIVTMIKCRALSVTDCYWLKLYPDDTWDKLNLYENSYTEVLDEIALNRSSKTKFTLNGNLLTPELSTDGTYAKCWQRESDGIYLYKTGAGRKEVEAEVMASRVAEILGIPHVEYKLAVLYNRRCCKCRDMANTNLSIVPYEHIATCYTKEKGFMYNMNILDIEKVVQYGNGSLDDFYRMLIFDGLVCNIDRHSHNWGFYQDTNTNKLLGLHPMFDHNCAIDISEGIDRNSSVYSEMSILEMAKYGLRYVKDTIDLQSLKDYYSDPDTKKEFKELYGRVDELDMLKKLYDLVTG